MKLTSEHRGGAPRRSGVSADFFTPLAACGLAKPRALWLAPMAGGSMLVIHAPAHAAHE